MSRTKDRTYLRNRRRALRESDVCWICGQWIDPGVRWPDPMSATADHVHAIKDGGDNRGEVRPAHFRCNVRRTHAKPQPNHSRRW
jgi:hypothetical protein